MRNHQALLDLYKYTKAMNRMGGLRIEVQKGARAAKERGERREGVLLLLVTCPPMTPWPWLPCPGQHFNARQQTQALHHLHGLMLLLKEI